MKKSGTLYVQMFGSFQLYYEGRPLTGEKLRDTYFSSLMQILLHQRAAGVSRDYLEDVLFGDRDVENRHQALQTIVYKAKKKLKNMGLPEENYIYLEKGLYFWTPAIPVSEDASIFDELCDRAKAETEEDERLRLYLEACYIYKGEFLSAYMAVLWAASEARRYRERFCVCVEGAAGILRKKKDWNGLEKLGRHASKTAPFSDWEGLTMEALVESGRYEEARKLYADTSDSYRKEQGVAPSGRMMEWMDRLGNQLRHPYEVLDRIQEGLAEEPDGTGGGYPCPYPVFRGIYQVTARMMERGGQSIYLMLCTLVDGKGNPMREGERLKELAGRLGEAIQRSIRRGDVMNQYGSGQFLVLLVNTTREDCGIVEERISRNFLTGRQRTGVSYYVNSVICEL